MITVIHGDDIASSRNYLTTLSGSVKDPIMLSGESLDITQLTQILDGGGLFDDPKFVSIERLLSNKKMSDSKAVIELLAKHSDSHSIVIWENKELTKATLNKFPKATVRQFKFPQTLFLLMDAIRPNNIKQILTLYHTTRSRVEEELILYMLARHVRLLLATKTSAQITEIRQASWQAGKLHTQAKQFTLEQLKMLHSEIYNIERAMKTGESVHSTSTLIDFLLLKI